ncbi:unnamed protein product [Prunus brigantina]
MTLFFVVRVRGVGAGISTRQYFNLPRQQRVKFADQLKESVRDVFKEETLKMEARTKQLVEVERENLLNQLRQLIPNFDPSLLKLKNFQGPEQSPKNPMSDKASCSGALDVRALKFEDDNAKNGEKQEEMQKDKCLDVSEKEQQAPDYSNLVLPSSLQALCHYMETTLKVHEKAMIFTIEKEVFGFERQTFVLIEDITQFAAMDEIGATVVAVYIRCLFDVLKTTNMVNMVGFVDPAQVSANSGSLTQTSRLLANRLQKTDGEQIFFMPYNPGHALDVMHIEKNVCDSIIGTLLEIPGKNKDGIDARLDLLNIGVKIDLQPEYGERRTRLPPGPWNFSKAEKRAVCNSFYGCIAERYIAEEAIEFCTEYLSDISTIGVPSSQKMGLLKPLTGCTVSLVDRDLLNQAHLYGVIQDIWDLDYQKFTITMFRCDWIDSTSGLVVDEFGFTLVDLSKIGHRNDQFVMASQVKQVFFVDDPMHHGWSVVLSMPNREYNDVIGDNVLGDVRIECEPFTRGMPNVDTFDELAGESGSQNIRDGCEDIWIE